eukprot:scaffold93013_cov27-Tisochrysis_lutea.AAC.1
MGVAWLKQKGALDSMLTVHAPRCTLKYAAHYESQDTTYCIKHRPPPHLLLHPLHANSKAMACLEMPFQ